MAEGVVTQAVSRSLSLTWIDLCFQLATKSLEFGVLSCKGWVSELGEAPVLRTLCRLWWSSRSSSGSQQGQKSASPFLLGFLTVRLQTLLFSFLLLGKGCSPSYSWSQHSAKVAFGTDLLAQIRLWRAAASAGALLVLATRSSDLVLPAFGGASSLDWRS